MMGMYFSREEADQWRTKAMLWVDRLQDGAEFSAFVFGKELSLDFAPARNEILDQLEKYKLIEPTSRAGWYRKIAPFIAEVDWENAEAQHYPLAWPLDIHEMALLSPGTMALVAGEKSSGKTTFLLSLILANLSVNGGLHEHVNYFNSEMQPPELKARLLNIAPKGNWSGLHVFNRSRDFHLVVRPNELNVIDYMAVYGKFYEVGEWIEKIHQRLGGGIAIIGMQKKKGEEYARGGEFTMERPRLGLSLWYDGFANTCKIVDCKTPVGVHNPTGLERDFRIIRGREIEPITGWDYVDKQARKQRSYHYRLQAESEQRARQNYSAGYKGPSYDDWGG